MVSDAYRDIAKLESDLWAAADNLRANSKLTSSDYFMPVLGVIFLRHAANRFDVATRQIEANKAELAAVPGLVKLVDRAEIEAADWSLTPGRYVGVAPGEVDEDFDFEQTMRDIHTELADLDKEAAGLAAKIQENFGELGV